MTIEQLPLEDGKYTFVYNTETGRLTCLRYGEPWRDNFVGDKAVFALFCEAQRYQTKRRIDEQRFVREHKPTPEMLIAWRMSYDAAIDSA